MEGNAITTRRIWMFVFLGLALVGAGFYVNQLINGLQVTGMNNLVSWGLYIITFAFLVGLSAGGLIISSSAYIFKVEELKKVAPIGIVVAVACIIGAAFMILVDIGRPERVLNILFSSTFTSPIKWDFFVIGTYLIIGLYECWIFFGNKWKLESEERREAIFAKAAIISLPIALLVHSITAWIFGLQAGRPFWNNGLMAPIFISSAVVSGLGLLLLISFLGRKLNIPGLDKENVETLAKILIGFIFLDLFLFFCELFTLAYTGGTAPAEAVALIMTGKFAPLLWFEIIVGMILPLVILFNKSARKSSALVGLSGLLVMLAVFLKRINIILPGFLIQNIHNAPGTSTGRFVQSTGLFFEAGETPFKTVASYMPTAHELIITVGGLSLVAFIILFGVGLIMKMDSPAKAAKKEANNKVLSSEVA